MADVRLYISRHGKTMFNTIGRVQGWCDTPLTKAGEEGIRELGLGLKDAGLDFKLAVSSDLGRTVQTMTIAQRELGILGKSHITKTSVSVNGALVVSRACMMPSFSKVSCLV